MLMNADLNNPSPLVHLHEYTSHLPLSQHHTHAYYPPSDALGAVGSGVLLNVPSTTTMRNSNINAGLASTTATLTAMPDQSAFEHDHIIEKKKRQKRLSAPHAGLAAHAQMQAADQHYSSHLVPPSLSSSHGRPQCPDTPMKPHSPSIKHGLGGAFTHSSSLHHQTPYNNSSRSYPASLASSLGRGANTTVHDLSSTSTSGTNSLNSSFRGTSSADTSFAAYRGGGGTDLLSCFNSEFNSAASSPMRATPSATSSTMANTNGSSSLLGSSRKRRAAQKDLDSSLPIGYSHHPSAIVAPVPPPSLVSSLGRSSTSSHFASFTNLGLIARGCFGEVWHVCDQSGNESAVKKSIRPYKGENDRAARMKEVESLRKVKMVAEIEMANATANAASTSAQHIPDSRHIVSFISFWEESKHLHIQTELLHGGTVREYLESLEEPLSEGMIWLMLLDLIRGLRFLHEKAKIAHLDMKWENTFMAIGANGGSGSSNNSMSDTPQESSAASSTSSESDTGILKIGDFGCSSELDNLKGSANQPTASIAFSPTPIASTAAPTITLNLASAFNATRSNSTSLTSNPLDDLASDLLLASQQQSQSHHEPEEGDKVYLAPEFFDATLAPNGIGEKADIFSLGMMLLEVMCDISLPKGDEGWHDLRTECFDSCWQTMQASQRHMPELRAIVERMLARQPERRPTASEILQHPRLVDLAAKDASSSTAIPERVILRNLPSVLPTRRIHLGHGQLVHPSPARTLSSHGLIRDGGCSSDFMTTPPSMRTSPVGTVNSGGSVTSVKRRLGGTPMSLTRTLAACTPMTNASSANTSMQLDSPSSTTSSADLSANLFNSSLYSSRPPTTSRINSLNSSRVDDTELEDAMSITSAPPSASSSAHNSLSQHHPLHSHQPTASASASGAYFPSVYDDNGASISAASLRELSKTIRRSASSQQRQWDRNGQGVAVGGMHAALGIASNGPVHALPVGSNINNNSAHHPTHGGPPTRTQPPPTARRLANQFTSAASSQRRPRLSQPQPFGHPSHSSDVESEASSDDSVTAGGASRNLFDAFQSAGED